MWVKTVISLAEVTVFWKSIPQLHWYCVNLHNIEPSNPITMTTTLLTGTPDSSSHVPQIRNVKDFSKIDLQLWRCWHQACNLWKMSHYKFIIRLAIKLQDVVIKLWPASPRQEPSYGLHLPDRSQVMACISQTGVKLWPASPRQEPSYGLHLPDRSQVIFSRCKSSCSLYPLDRSQL